MTDETKTTEKKAEEVKTDVPVATEAKAGAATQSKNPRRNDRNNNDRRQRRPRRGPRREERKEFEQKIISIRRVTRVVAGGRRFSFSVAMVIGDGKGRVGVGVAKAADTALAIEKSVRQARRNMVTLPLTDSKSIAHDVAAKYCASEVEILPAPGRGIVAGSSVRTVLELAGVRDVTAKIFSRSKNRLNNARATIQALGDIKVSAR